MSRKLSMEGVSLAILLSKRLLFQSQMNAQAIFGMSTSDPGRVQRSLAPSYWFMCQRVSVRVFKFIIV